MKADNYNLNFHVSIKNCVKENFDIVNIYKYVQDNS